MEPILKEAQKVWKQYQDGLNYKRQMGFLTKWPEYERFKAGDQWPPATERTKNLPRPVFNIIELIEAHKVSSVMNEQIKMVFSTLEEDEALTTTSETFTRYSETMWENIQQNMLNEEALENAANRGTGIWHYYWDSNISGGNLTVYQGDICGEVIDPVNVFFGNPQQRNVQKQPYIIISSRDLVETVKAEAKANGVSAELITQITGDKETLDQGYDMAQVELQDSDKVTVLTKYWKKDGRVYFTRVASGLVIKQETDTGLKLYPIAVMPWKRRKKSIFGNGETEGLIPNQKTINFLMAMQTLSVQLTGWPKLVYKSGTIDPSKVTNTPGEMILDKSPPGTKGIDYLVPGSMSNMAQVLVDKFVEYTKEMTGANDAATGEAPGSDLNATAIMLLQKASGVPIESIKRRFYQAMEDVGRIWEDFWKVKYNTTRLIKIKDDDGNDVVQEFNGTDHTNVHMNLKIDIGPSSSYSESLMMSSLDRFLDNQLITFQQYLKYVPKNVVPFKDRLLKEIEQQHAQEQHQQAMTEQAIRSLPPDQQQALMQSPPEVQQQMIGQLMQQPQPSPQQIG